jgi:hypothetical protein
MNCTHQKYLWIDTASLDDRRALCLEPLCRAEVVVSKLSPRERELMEHALGRDYPHKKPRDFRNYYAADRAGREYREWSALVERRLATKRTEVSWTPLIYFAVSDAGKAALDGKAFRP